MDLLSWLGASSLLAWLYMSFAHGRFWLGDQRLSGAGPAPAHWPSVVTCDSARRHHQGLGARWKGRIGAGAEP